MPDYFNDSYDWDCLDYAESQCMDDAEDFD